MRINRIVLQRVLNSKGINATDLRKEGISSATLAKIAKGDDIRVSTLLRISEILDVDAEQLVESDPYLSFLKERYETATLRI